MHILSKFCFNRIQFNASNFKLSRFKNQSLILSRKNLSTDSFLNLTLDFNTTIVNSSVVNYLQKSFVFIHDLTNLPWCAEIFCIALCTRLFTLPFYIYEKKQAAKYQNLLIPELISMEPQLIENVKRKIINHEIKPDQMKLTYEHLRNRKIKELYIKHNVHPFKRILTLLSTFPIYLSTTFAIGNLCSRNNKFIQTEELSLFLSEVQPQFEQEGMLWFSNMISVDKTYILPITFGILYLSIIEYNALLRRYNLVQPILITTVLTNLLRIASVFLTIGSCFLPSAIVFYWWTAAFFGLSQNYAFANRKFRNFLRIPETKFDLNQPKFKEIIKYNFFTIK